MYLFLSSSDCVDTHPDNNALDFTIDLLPFLDLKGKWECGLLEIEYKPSKKDMFLYCDLCDSSYVQGNYLPLLRFVKKCEIYEYPLFIPISREVVSHIRVYIRDAQGNIPSFSVQDLRCTLEIRKTR